MIKKFEKKTTILVIGHTVKTIIAYDKVLVLDAGEIKEFDTPYSLFSKSGSIFRSLCDKAKIKDQDFEFICLEENNICNKQINSIRRSNDQYLSTKYQPKTSPRYAST